MDKSELTKLYIEHKFSLLREVINSLMLWWVSSVVFCGSIISALLFNNDKILTLPLLLFHSLFFLIFMFFTSIVVFGIKSSRAIKDIGQEINEISQKMDSEIPKTLNEIDAIFLGIRIGTTSFGICIVFLVMIWLNAIIST